MKETTVDRVSALYREHGAALAQVRKEQLKLRTDNPSMRTQLDDIEAEITYLLLRDRCPETVVEIGTLHGWSTTWILHALRDNGRGRLYSFDLVDTCLDNVPDDVADGRWTFARGDVRKVRREVMRDADYLFIDADHGARFANWYVEDIFPEIQPGTPVSVHDVFHGRRAKPFSEGAVVLRRLAARGIPFFTASRARAPAVHRHLTAVKEELGLADPVWTGRRNPMIFFTMR